jgi:hypothetical protein
LRLASTLGDEEKEELSSEYWRRHFKKWASVQPSEPAAIRIVGEPDQECIDQTFVDSERVINVEREISRIEYEGIDWNLGQTLGWFAYGNEMDFRSLKPPGTTMTSCVTPWCSRQALPPAAVIEQRSSAQAARADAAATTIR